MPRVEDDSNRRNRVVSTAACAVLGKASYMMSQPAGRTAAAADVKAGCRAGIQTSKNCISATAIATAATVTGPSAVTGFARVHAQQRPVHLAAHKQQLLQRRMSICCKVYNPLTLRVSALRA